MTKTRVPKVNLLDINREPTDDELEALMQDMVDVANEKRRLALDTYMTDLFAGIDEAAKVGVAKAKARRSQSNDQRDLSER